MAGITCGGEIVVPVLCANVLTYSTFFLELTFIYAGVAGALR